MKRIYLFLIFVLILSFAQAQLEALFVNDNKVDEEASELVYGILEQYLGTLDQFNAVTEERSPTAQEMSDYSLVIWYCGMDPDELYFWNGNYQDNPNLESYLDGGGSLWVMGQQFFNARYIKPPRQYSDGNFVFDYLGIESWAVETYTDDNGVGVPVLLKDNNSIINPSLDSLNWEDPPEAFVDGCNLVEGVDRTYFFGPTGYAYYGKSAAFYYPINGFKNLTFTFDPAQLDSKGSMEVLLSDVLMFYEDVLSSIDQVGWNTAMKLYPNPAKEHLNVELKTSERVRIRVVDLVGNQILDQWIEKNNTGMQSVRLDVSDLSPGMFFISIETANDVRSQSFVVTR